MNGHGDGSKKFLLEGISPGKVANGRPAFANAY